LAKHGEEIVKSEAEGSAPLQSAYDLSNHGLSNLRHAYWNLSSEVLYEHILARGEGQLARGGGVVVRSGKHTARAAADKFVVREGSSEEHVWWGEYNRPFSEGMFDALHNRLQAYLQGKDVYVQDCWVGADARYRLPIRIISEHAWHSLFARNMFIKPQSAEEYRSHVPEFSIICAPSFHASPSMDGTRTSTFIIINFARKVCIIGDTGYGGEIKKSVFTLLNYLWPLQDILTMHCGANMGPEGDVAIFFGLSGTGKTTLSADPSRSLIGDDEHAWTDDGIFNFEDGAYAKVIRLSPTAEPQIYAAVHRFGAILENVIFNPLTRQIDLDDDAITENTRASYPLSFIDNALPEKMAGHPQNIVMLTCDASGVMPPIARLNTEQAMYQFVSGYTAKIAGTEAGIGDEPQITFSTCFGAPFMVHHPARYAELLKGKIEQHGVNCWLLNTGWVGGKYGVGKRIAINYTRAMLAAALDGALLDVEYRRDSIFGYQIPLACPGIPTEVLDPAAAWSDKEEYMAKYRQLAARFIENFKKYAPDCPPGLAEAGPSV
jgi:phosphoenolpyruvate carboxykinase (ATP)